ncbi:MAG: Gfo/Idh/MocA family oxidoreductase [Clostridiales bacterium]|nr:Gfo/Idh/MocA family oxidoreductase [Clostridiales bacterium]
MAKYRMALIGFGGMAGWHTENVRQKIKDIEVVGAYDIRPEALETAKERGLKAYETLEELLSDETIDLVTVATPNNFHKELSIAALRAGKHVLCEKPVTMNAAELEEIMAVQKETGKIFTIHQNRRWDRDFLVAKLSKEQGLLGDVYMVESKVQGSRQSLHGWRGYAVNGGGMLYDWGVHLLDQALQMFGDEKVVSVGAHLCKVFANEVDDNNKLFLRFEKGASYEIEITTNCLINSPRWHIQGTGGTLEINEWSGNGTLRRLKENAEMTWSDDIVYTAAGPTRTMAPRPEYTMEEVPLPKSTGEWSQCYENIVAVMDGREELFIKPEQALRVMKVIDLMFVADKENRSIACEI